MTDARIAEIEAEYRRRYGQAYKELHEVIAALRTEREAVFRYRFALGIIAEYPANGLPDHDIGALARTYLSDKG